jgi:tetratricopeptide (TPR) repeat protein
MCPAAHAGDAQDCESSREWAFIVRACSAVIAHDPGSQSVAWAYNKRGLAHENLHESENALRDYSAAISADPRYVEAYVNRGARLTHDAFFASVTDNRTKASAFYSLAESDFSRALQIDWRNVRAYFERGKMHLHQAGDNPRKSKELDSAIADFSRAIDLDPQYGAAYRERGIANQTRGNDDQAIADYTRAIGFFARDPLMYEFRGRAYAQRARSNALSDTYLVNGPGKADMANAIKADLDHAVADYDRALALGAKDEGIIRTDRERTIELRKTIK